MTTSEPQAGRRDDDAREHRSIGQRIRDAVLGEEPDDARGSAPGGRTADTGYAQPGQDTRDYAEPDRGATGYAEPDRGATGYADPTPAGRDVTDRGPATGYDPADRELGDRELGDRELGDRELGDRDLGDRDLAGRDADRGPAAVAAPTRGSDAFGAESAGADTAAGYAEAPRGDTGYADADRDVNAGAPREATYGDAAGGVPRGVGDAPPSGDSAFSADDPGRRVAPDSYGAGGVPDPVTDDLAQDGRSRGAGYTDSDYADSRRTADPGDTGRADPGDTGRVDPAYADDTRGTAASGDRDFVTSSFDPDRDTGYDPHAAGTAATAPVGAGDDLGDDDTRGYQPAADTGYVDEQRADVDRTTGDRDADYDTGRVDTDRDTSHRAAGLGAAAAVAAGGAGVAAGVAGSHHQDAEGRHTDGRDTVDRDTVDRDTRFSAADDTSTVDATSTGRTSSGTTLDDTTAPPSPTTTAGTTGDVAADQRAEAVADEADESDSGGRERLVPADRAGDYSSRWDALKGDFVDEPRRAVTQADQLVGEVLDDIQRLFTDQRRDLDAGFDHDQASTEDLRLALRRYRSFFDRLLSL